MSEAAACCGVRSTSNRDFCQAALTPKDVDCNALFHQASIALISMPVYRPPLVPHPFETRRFGKPIKSIYDSGILKTLGHGLA